MDHGSYDELQHYCAEVTNPGPEYLERLYRATHLRCIHPRMVSGRLLGRSLSLISKLAAPRHILEIGSYTGYSALCLAEGLSSDGHLLSIDKNDELGTIQDEFVKQSPYAHQVEFRVGNALDILPELPSDVYDLVFLDADKENYHRYLPMLLRCMTSGGLLLVDNMLWEGKVLDERLGKDEQTQSILSLTQEISENPKLEQILLPIRDGLMVIRINK